MEIVFESQRERGDEAGGEEDVEREDGAGDEDDDECRGAVALGFEDGEVGDGVCEER